MAHQNALRFDLKVATFSPQTQILTLVTALNDKACRLSISSTVLHI